MKIMNFKQASIILFMMVITSSMSTMKAEYRNPSSSMNIDTAGQFIAVTSSFIAASWVKAFPMIAYLNVESGGRSRRILDKSLLRPGLGGQLVVGKETSFGKPSEAVYENGKICYRNVRIGNEKIDWTIEPISVKQINMTIHSCDAPLGDEFFRLSTAPDVSPVSIWAKSSKQQPSTQYDTSVSIYKPAIIKASYSLPAILHFPDYGLIKIESSDKNVYLQEHFIPDYENTGLSLGQYNYGGHLWRKSIHLGSVVLSLHTDDKIHDAHITITVMDENYPHIEGCDFSDSRFDGLKRCWQNAFTVNPETHTMGDNIVLSGIGHLSLFYKSDMLVFTPSLPCAYSMKEAMRTSIERAFNERIGNNGRIKDYGWECTETTLISLYGYLLSSNDWKFVEQYTDSIRRLVRGVLDTDTDHDGIFESPFHGNRMEDNRTSFNWWDDFAFGHKDAFVNLLAYRALLEIQDMFEKMGYEHDADEIKKHLDLFRKSFHKTFYNPTTGMYAGWISQDGHIHDYQFTFINAMAINLDLVESSLSKKILKKILNKLKEQGYDFVYGIPGPLVSVADSDKSQWEEMSRWGRYENGGLCGQTAYHFIQALYKTGMRKQADKILFTMMETYEREYTHSGLNPGYLQSVDWRTKGGAPTGYNYLADNYYFLLATITGYYQVNFPQLKYHK